jgi:hypothetical protein
MLGELVKTSDPAAGHHGTLGADSADSSLLFCCTLIAAELFHCRFSDRRFV